MGEFVTVSAFRTQDAEAVRDGAVGFFSVHSWPAEPFHSAGSVTEDDVLIYPPVNGWTVVMWSGYFTELAAVEYISRQLGILTSTVRIHDSDYWSHALLRDGVVLDRFATMPDYFTDDPDEIARLRAKYAGQPAVVAEAIGRPVEQVAPYLVHVNLEDGEDEDGYYVDEPELGKAFPDDEFELDSPWVFADFWKRLGPRYPEDPSAYLARIRLASGWSNKLPAGDAEL
ncbi:hypothetical protein Pth03_79400 [Planotetraspora thailandica]|uniref:Uncharacterized protein n=1 Tax=Planotetraspora thailandica TaxID=487172 RepID=A0A8J4DFM1_9ACTN|nr:hypothetical protein [Planotetraspora thailandica]GII59551.1 hypothetical protein Pth03_79400 [Planotetraspora thailandica]